MKFGDNIRFLVPNKSPEGKEYFGVFVVSINHNTIIIGVEQYIEFSPFLIGAWKEADDYIKKNKLQHLKKRYYFINEKNILNDEDDIILI